MSAGKVQKTAKLITKLGFAGLGWLGGLFAAVFVGNYASIFILAAAAFVSAAFLLFGAKYGRFMVLVSVSALAAAVWFTGYEHISTIPIRQLAGKQLSVTGTITKTESFTDRTRLTIKGRADGRKLKTTVYTDDFSLKVGDRVSAQFTAEIPETTPLYNGEDRAAENGVFIISNDIAEVTKLDSRDVVLRIIGRFREYTIRNIHRRCDSQAGAFIISILCADKSFVSDRTSDAVYRSGLGHIFAVSGTHVVILSAFIGKLLELLVRPRKLRSGVMLCLLTAFAIFAGCSPSVVRACIISGTGCLAVFFNRRDCAPNSLGAAAILITVQCPYAAFSASFLLSFSAAFAVSVLTPMLAERKLYGQTVSCFAIFLVTLPFSAYFFNEIPLFFAAVNFLLLPLCTFCLGLSFLFMISGCLLTPALYLSELLASAVIKACGALTAVPFTYTGVTYRPQTVMIGIAGAAAVIITALFVKNKSRCSAICVTSALIICSALSLLSLIKPADRLTVIPCKKGYAAELVTDGDLMLFDIGSGGESAYHAKQTARQLHTERILLFTEQSSSYTRDRYLSYIPDMTAEFAQKKNGSLRPMNGTVSLGKASVIYDGDYVIMINGHSITLGSELITIDGKEYFPEGFSDISDFALD